MPQHRIPNIFDQNRRRLRNRRARTLAQMPDAASWLDQEMIEDCVDRLDFMQLFEGKALSFGAASEQLASQLQARGFQAVPKALGSFDEERPWPFAPYDYIFAIRTLSTLNDLPGALLHIRNTLSQNGIMFAQILGAGSLPSLRAIMLAADGNAPAARIHPQIDNQAASGLLARAGFSKQVVDSRTLTVRFSSFERMIGDLRDQSLTGILSDRPPALSRAAFLRARAAFDQRRDADGKVSETFEVLALTAWR